jgi:hypothetical protein
MFKPATRRKLKLRMAIDGPSGSGKTLTALRTASGLGSKIAVIDTEHRSASKYLGDTYDDRPLQFDVCELTGGQYSPSTYTAAIKAAGAAGYDVLVIDSLTHAWDGAGGALDIVDRKSAGGGGNNFTAWRDVTPMHREMIDAILACPAHVIVTMRSKMEYAMEPDPKTGKTTVRKVGMAPIQRQGTEYEFDVVADMDLEHVLSISKTRCPAIDGQRVVKPGASFVEPLRAWLDAGTVEQPATPAPATTPASNGNGDAQAMMQQAFDGQSKPITRAQRNEIIILTEAVFGKGEPTKAAIAKAVEKRGKARLDDLTTAQAAVMVENLQRIVRDREVSRGGPPSQTSVTNASGATAPTAEAPSGATPAASA